MSHFNRLAFAGIMLALIFTAVAARADVPAFTMSGFSNDQSTNSAHWSLGYTFQLQQDTSITAIGALDIGGSAITSAQPVLVKIYWSNPTANYGTTYPSGPGGQMSGLFEGSSSVSAADPIFSLSGGVYTSGDGFRYHTLDAPLQLGAGYYMITESTFGTGFKTNAVDFAMDPTVIGPTVGGAYHPTFDGSGPFQPDDTADFNSSTRTAEFDAPGMFGPNFLISVPEPGDLVLLVACGGWLLRRPVKPRIPQISQFSTSIG